MKKINRTVVSATLFIACLGINLAVAHERHDVISSKTALNIANKSVKQLTFKDLGYDVGKLDASWTSLTDTDFRMVQMLEKTFIVSATNATNDTVIYFEIAKNGKVLGVKDSSIK